MKKISLFIVGLSLLFFAIIQSVSAATFGISPPEILNQTLKPNSHFVYVIHLSTNDPAEDMTVETRFSGDPQIAEWISIQDKTSLIMPKGQSRVPVTLHLDVPSQVKSGHYKGNISFIISPKNKSNDSISLRLGGHVSVQLSIVDHDVADYQVGAVTLEPSVEGEPFQLRVRVKNIGNVPIRSLKTDLEVLDHETGDLLFKQSAADLSASILPQSVGTAFLTLPTLRLSAGRYRARITSYKEGEAVYENHLPLIIDPSHSSAQEGSKNNSSSSFILSLFFIFFALLVFLVTFLIFKPSSFRRH